MNIIIKKITDPDKFKAWGQQIQGPRKAEAVESMKSEGTISEGFYCFEINGEKYAIGYQVVNPAEARHSQSVYSIDAEHKAIRAESMGERIKVETIYEIDNFMSPEEIREIVNEKIRDESNSDKAS